MNVTPLLSLSRPLVVARFVACVALFALRPDVSIAADNWTGTIRCEINVSADGYSHQETQTWTLAGTPPTPQGSSKIYAATWAVTGQGWHDRTNTSASRRIASWTASVSGRSAPIGFLVTTTGELVVHCAPHAQLTAHGGYTGTDQFIQNGVTQTPQRLQATVYEWQLQPIRGLPTDTQLTGTHTSQPVAFLGPMQPHGAQITVTLAWALGQGTAPPLPPSSLPPQPPQPASNPPGGSPTDAGRPPREPVPQLVFISPAEVSQGAPDVHVTLKGQGTHWQTDVTTADFGPDIRVAELKVNSPTEVEAWVQVYASAAIGPRVVKLTTLRPAGPEVVSLGDKFTVNAVLTAAPGPILVPPPVATNPPVLPSPPPIGTAPTSGNYRIILNGLRVNHRTFEGVENDGSGDEIYASVRVQTCKRDLSSWDTTVVKTAVHGNVQHWPDRIRGGSAHELGGFVAGDTFPAGQDPARLTALPLPQTFPLLVWEGTLSDASDVVLIKPSLWEADGDECVYNRWAAGNTDLTFGLSLGGELGKKLKQTVLDRIAQSDLSPIAHIGWPIMCFNFYGIDIGSGCDCQPGKDRPIGLINGNEQAGTFNCPGIVFTHEAIEKALGASLQPGGLPQGVMVLHFADTGFHFEGDYDLFLRVERVHGASPAPPPGGVTGPVDVAPVRPPERGVAPEPPTAEVTPVRPPERGVAPEPPPTGKTLLRLTPHMAQQGQQGVTILLDTAPSQFFSPNGTAAFGAGIALRSFQMLSPTSARAVVDIALDAPVGLHAVTLSRALRPAETFPDVFTVTAAPAVETGRIRPVNPGLAMTANAPALAQVGPSSWLAGAPNLRVTLTGRNTHWVNGTTTADFGSGIVVTQVHVDSPTSAWAVLNIGRSALAGPRTVTVTTGTEVVALPDGFTVSSGVSGQTLDAGGGGVIAAENDPGLFAARQTGPSSVQLSWNAVPGAAAYVIFGPAVENGIKFTGTSTTVSGLAPGTYQWFIASWYEPDGVRTPVGKRRSTRITVVRTEDTYRVTATSVTFHKDESDNPGWGGDGRSNEIYITSFAQVIDRRSGAELAKGPLFRSAVHGDTNANPSGGVRVRAGSYTSSGGIRTGDVVNLRTHSSTGGSETPCWIWSGVLRDGIDVLILRPVLWEFDGVEGPWLTPYTQRLQGEASGAIYQLPAVAGWINQPNLFAGVVPQLQQGGPWTPDREDHPLGLTLANTGRGGLVAGSDPDLAWFDRVIVLTREKLELLLQAGNGSASVEMRLSGDGRDWIADCTLKLTVERGAPPSSGASSVSEASIKDALKKLLPKIEPGGS